MQPGSGQPATGERWNVNMPAVIGVVFVLLIAVVVWVIASAVGDDGDAAVAPTSTTVVAPQPTSATSAPTSTDSATGTTSPAPMPATTLPATSMPATSAPAVTAPVTTAPPTTEPPPATAAPATTAPGAEPGTVPGDLGVAGRPMQRPPCDGFITVLASPIGGQATAESLATVLDQYPGSNYLRTDETCSSLNPSSGGEPIYVVYFGPFAADSDACAARSDGPDGAYARRLSNDVSPDHFVDCS